MKKIDFMTREEMIDIIETLAWRVATLQNPDGIIDDEAIELVLEEEGVRFKNE